MGEKDIAGKDFFGCSDVIADAINVLRFQGEQMVSQNVLIPAYTETVYGENMGKLLNQLEDVAVYDMRKGMIQALYLISNQKAVDSQMVFRKAGYVGGAYRMQYKNPKKVIELQQPIGHPVELFNFLHALSDDAGYLELADMLNEIGQNGGEKKTMCELLDMYRVGEGWDKVRELNETLKKERKKRDKEVQKERRKSEKEIQKEHKAGLRASIAACKKFNASFEATVETLKESFGLDEETARQQVELYWQKL